MPNELFGSVGLALPADRRRPKTLARRLTIKERKRQAASYYFIAGASVRTPVLREFRRFVDRVCSLRSQLHQSTCDSPGKLTEPQRLSQNRMWVAPCSKYLPVNSF